MTSSHVQKLTCQYQLKVVNFLIAKYKIKDLLADDLTYSHTKGNIETKSGYLTTVKTKRTDYLSMVPRDVNVRVYDNTAVLTGLADVKLIYSKGLAEFTIRFLEVQRKVEGGWQLVAWQSVVYKGK